MQEKSNIFWQMLLFFVVFVIFVTFVTHANYVNYAPKRLALVVVPLAVPDVGTELAVGGLGLELGHGHIQEVRGLHHVSGGAGDGCELVEACELGCSVRSGTFAADLGVLTVGVGLVHVGYAGFFTEFATYVVNRVKINNLCHDNV